MFPRLFCAVSAVWLLMACADGSPAGEAVAVSPFAQKMGYTKDHPLVMGMNTSYAPLQFVDDKGTPSGFDVEFTKVLMRRMGIPFAFSPNHWDQMSPGILGGKYDMGLLVYSPYRKDSVNYSNAVFRLYYQVVYRKKDYAEFDFRNLKGRQIAYMKSRPIGIMLQEAGAVDERITDLGQAFIDLAAGQYDGLICYRFQAKYNIEHLGLGEQLQADELSLEPREYCYASVHQELIDSINVELRRMEAEGIIDEVYGQDVVQAFGVSRIPVWIWYLIAALTFIFLIVFSVNRYRLSRHLQIAHKRLQIAYRQMEENNVALQAANIRAEESTRMKTAFIKQISHEIRTPLNILSGFTQVLATPDSRLSEAERAEASRQVVESTARITGLVNKMLELSDISSNTVLNRDEEVTAQYVDSLAVMTSGVEKAEHIDFDLRFEAGVDQPFKTHLSSVVRIVELLLDNAIKFTHPPEAYMAKLKVTRKERVTLSVGYENGVVRFVVEDTGIGIPENEAEHIFDEFVQLDEYYDGTGIGLAVARSLARRLDGDVVLDTSYTNGARFVVTLAG
jgi:signal transduction histidine kinase